jgi:hypothetical protein
VVGDVNPDCVRPAHFDKAAPRRIFDCIGQKVADNLKQQVGVAADGQRLSGSDSWI